MIVIYKINSSNVKSIDDLIYFYYSMLTANAYVGDVRIYTDFNYFEFFAYLPYEFYPDFRDDETFKNDVLSELKDYILVDDCKKVFFESIHHSNYLSVDAVINEVGKVSNTLLNKLVDKISNNNIVL